MYSAFREGGGKNLSYQRIQHTENLALGTQSDPHKHLVGPVDPPHRLMSHCISCPALSSGHLRSHGDAPHLAEAGRPGGALTHITVTCALPVQNLQGV